MKGSSSIPTIFQGQDVKLSGCTVLEPILLQSGFLWDRLYTNPNPQQKVTVVSFFVPKTYPKAESHFFGRVPPQKDLWRERCCTFLVVWWSLGSRNHLKKISGELIVSFLIPSILLVELVPRFCGNKRVPVKLGVPKKVPLDHRWMAFSKCWVVTFYLFILFILLRCNYKRIHSPSMIYENDKTGGLFFFCRQGPPQSCEISHGYPKWCHMWSRRCIFPIYFWRIYWSILSGGEISRKKSISPVGVWIIYRTGPPRPTWFTRNLMLVILGLNRSWIFGGLYQIPYVYKAICNMIILHSLLYTTHYQPFYWVGFF